MASVIVFCKTLVKGGAEKQALTLARLLADRSTDVVVVSWSRKKVDPRNHEFIIQNSLKYYGLHGGLLMRLIQFNQIIKKEKANVIIAYLTLANFVSGISRLFNRDIVTLGGIRTEKLPLYKFVVEKFVHNHLNDATIFNNYSAKAKFTERGFNPDKIFVIHNAISRFKPENLARDENVIGVITVARFVGAKDFRTGLLAFKKLTDRTTNRTIRYILVGYGPMESDIRMMIRSFGLEGKVEIIINPPDVSYYLGNADIYLSTSLFEGLSNSLMEAMMARLPIVATNVGDNSFLVKDRYNGYLVPLQDVDETASKLEILATSGEMRKRFGSNSYALITGNFNEEKLTESYLELIGQIQAKP